VRLSLDLKLQKQADQLLGDHKGAVILMNAQTGEILVMASHPTYDPNQLDEIGAALAQDQNTPLINRAVQGTYPPGLAVAPFLNIFNLASGINDTQKINLFDSLGFYTSPQIRMPVAGAAQRGEINQLRVSPLQMSIAAGILSNHGVRIAPRIVLAVNTSQQGWIFLPALGQSTEALNAATADDLANQLAIQGQPFWKWISGGKNSIDSSTWYLGGTLPNWKGAPLDVVVLLEEYSPISVESIGSQLLKKAITP
jgi:cell division protein FtsI/penicillin-binding protein 2